MSKALRYKRYKILYYLFWMGITMIVVGLFCWFIAIFLIGYHEFGNQFIYDIGIWLLYPIGFFMLVFGVIISGFAPLFGEAISRY